MRKKIVLLLFLSIFVGLQIWCSSITFKMPYMGIYLGLNQQNEWVIEELAEEGAHKYYNLRVGDIIKQVDGKSPNDNQMIYKWRVVEQAHKVLVSRDGIEHEIVVDNRNVITYDVVPLLEELLCLFMAGLLYMKLRHSSSAKLLAVVFLTCGIIYLSQGASVRGDAVGKILITSLVMVLPFIFFHFLVVFFKEKGNIQLPARILKYLYAMAAVGFGIRLLILYPPTAYMIYRYNATVTLCFFIIGFLFNISVLTFVYFKIRKEKSYLSSIVRSVWFSLFLSFLPAICLSFLPQIITGQRIINAVYTSWFILFFPISFAYLIATNQLYDIGLVLRRIGFAVLLAIIPSGIFTGSYAFLFKDLVDARQIIFIFFGSIIMLSIVLYSTEYLTTRLERFLFPRKYVLQTALKKISKSLGAISSFRDLKEIVLVDIVNTLQVRGGAIVFQYENDTEIIDEGEIDTAEIKEMIRSSTWLQHPIYTCIEITRHEEYASYLVITRNKANTFLGKEEVQWLHLITSYLEVSLENVHLIRKLTAKMHLLAAQLPDEQSAQDIQWFRKIMFELQEEERLRIAADLHDTTMQDLFFLKRRFVSLLDKYAMNKEDKEHLNNIINFVELINNSLRQSCFELNPFLLKEIGLIETVRTYLDKEAYHTPFEIEFKEEEASAIESKDLKTKRHIFRIIQELLNNAKKHSQASKVSFAMTVKDHRFCLTYEDDGVGFDSTQVPRMEIGASGMGVEQMRGRILHLNGKLEFDSRQGAGVKLVITIPVQEVMSV
ncbi:two-component system, NarL family, sensor histidine kinase ComP [Paenibacillus tianmuensis]|uniref:histidine kinase n=1 Tax=Paenibacillus tianmuensis TaxID=624147 RepID=A0A1G4TDI3_9BACL|nr:two-component system, NarL family, sensor histidine kinase ComP [Paenibacillus tianmuensis]